jgi:hypothetical protein
MDLRGWRTTAYCPACGEEPLRRATSRFDDLAMPIFAALSNISGKLMRSLRAGLLTPGGADRD